MSFFGLYESISMVKVKLPIVLVCILAITASYAGGPSVAGKLKYDGDLLWDISRVEPRFWFRNNDTNKVAGGDAEYLKGKYEMHGLMPGNYGMAVNVDLNPENPLMYPGDLRAFRSFSVSRKGTTRLNVDLTKLIHLTKPVDNAVALTGWGLKCENKTVIKGPVTFEWEPITKGAYYNYKISKATCKPFKFGEVVASGTTQETQLMISLPVNSRNTVYRFTLNARKDGRAIGSFMTHGDNGHSWDYRFRVR